MGHEGSGKGGPPPLDQIKIQKAAEKCFLLISGGLFWAGGGRCVGGDVDDFGGGFR